MRKTITILLTASIAVGAYAAPMAEAAKRKKKVVRKASAEYTTPALALWASAGGMNIGGASFVTGGSEKYVSVELVDATGLPVPGSVQQDLDGDLQSGEAGEVAVDFCGKTDKPIKIVPGSDVIVYVQSGTCGGSVGTGTEGTINVKLQNIL